MTQLNTPQPVLRSVLVALMLAIFLGALDQTIVAVSMPAISAQFNDVGLLAWVISGYMVAMTVAVPIYGKLGDLYGRRRMILTGTALFTLASLLCALAQNMEQLVLARVLQGIGAGGMVSVSQAIIGDFVPPRERGRYQGYFSSMYALASVLGPVLGGYLTEYLSWRWVFWLNLPLGLTAWWVTRRALRTLAVPQRQVQVDYMGAALLIFGLSSLLLGITLIGQGQSWYSPAVSALLLCALIGLLVFVLHERRTPEPLLPLKLFANRVATLCWCTLFFTSFQAISLTMLMPLRYQSITGAGADSAALHLLPLAIGLPIGAYCGGRLDQFYWSLQTADSGWRAAHAVCHRRHGLYGTRSCLAQRCVHATDRNCIGPAVSNLAGRGPERSRTKGYRRSDQHQQPVSLPGGSNGGCVYVGAAAGDAATGRPEPRR